LTSISGMVDSERNLSDLHRQNAESLSRDGYYEPISVRSLLVALGHPSPLTWKRSAPC